MKNAEIAALLERTRYDQTAPAPTEQVVFRIQFQPIGSLGDFGIFSGRPKSGKTKYVAAALSAAVFRNEIFSMSFRLPENKSKVAHFDTEQSKYSHYRMMELIKKLSDAENLPEHFKSYRCRNVAPSHTLAMVEYFLKTNPDCGLVVLDGLVDTVESINDEKHCNFIKSWLKRITEDHNVLILGVIHRGFSNDKSIGHLGSALERTAQTVLVIEANRETKQYVLKTEYIRDGEHIEPIAIWYNKQIELWEQTEYIDGTTDDGKPSRMPKRTPADYTADEHREVVNQIFIRQRVQPYKMLLQNMVQLYATGNEWSKKCVKHLLKEEIIFWSEADQGYTLDRQARLIPLANINS